MAQFKVTLEIGADEQEAGREELNGMAVENASLRRRGEERKRPGEAVEEKAVTYTYEQIDSMKLRKLKEAAKKLRLSTVGNKQALRNRLKDAMEDEENHCYGCGSEAHSYRFCPDKDKGRKCFRFNNFGHIASNCNKLQQPSENRAGINCVYSTAERVAIRINSLLVYALLDTGSEVSIINSGIYDKLGRPRLYETTRRLAGFCNAITKPIGRCKVDIDIKGGIYKTDVFVVSQSDMSYEVLLGRELLKKLDVYINKRREKIRRPDKRLSEEISRGSLRSSDYGHVGAKYDHKSNVTTETKIKLTDNSPVCSKPRRLAPKDKKIVTQQLDEWLGEGIIQPSTKYNQKKNACKLNYYQLKQQLSQLLHFNVRIDDYSTWFENGIFSYSMEDRNPNKKTYSFVKTKR
ncbi:hypothetical protein M0802_012664 [Mischocyttarus mexicanus]|nr:hypothetical protein M0802_012664 [Mischocyttarus mexicanus]